MLFQINKATGYLFSILLLFFSISWNASLAQNQCDFTFPAGTICAGNACDAGATPFTGPVGATDYAWDFGVPNIETDTSSAQNPSYLYEQPGTYTVTLVATINGQQQTCTQQITVSGFDEFTIGPDDNLGPQEEEICIGSSITLTPTFQNGTPPNAEYLWSTGETTPTITTDTAGCYSVTITSNGCSRTNKVVVSLYKPDPDDPQPQQVQGIWYFGANAGIKFVGSQPEALPGGQVNTTEGSSSVINRDGKLLFYTDGITVWDSLGTVLPNGTGLLGSPNSTQSVVIVQQPGCSDCETTYYVFTTSEISATGSLLHYSVVDMRENNGSGAVTQKNIPLFNSSTERVIAVRGNPSDPNAPPTTWVVTHDFATNAFRIYPLTAQGVGTPQTYNVGAEHGPETVKGEGYIKASDDGSKIAIVIPGVPGADPTDSTNHNLVQVFDFDSATGEVSNPTTVYLGPAPPSAYGVELVNNQLFVSLTGNGAVESQLIRFDLTSVDSTAIANSRIDIATSGDNFGALQVGPDGKIYLAIQGSTSLGVINNPAGVDEFEMDFQEDGFNLGGGTGQLGLPNNSPTESRSYGQDFAYEGPTCADPGTQVPYRFQAQPDRAGGDPAKSTYLWTFPGGVTYTTAEVNHNFPGPGTYTVGLTIFNDCIPEGEVIDPKTIVIGENPPTVNLGADKTVCPDTDDLTLSAYPADIAGLSYIWTLPDGSTADTRTITASLQGNYSVVVSSNGECTKTDDINIGFTGPQVNLGADTSLCASGESITLNAGNPGIGATYQWLANNTPVAGDAATNGQTLTVTPSVTTTYEVIVTDPANPSCPGRDQITVTIGTPTVFPDPDVTPASGCDTADGAIRLTPPATGGPFTYAWTKDGQLFSQTQDVVGLFPGVYQVTITNAAGCTSTLTREINIFPGGAFDYSSPDSPYQLICGNPAPDVMLEISGTGTPDRIIWRNSNGDILQEGDGTLLTLTTNVADTYTAELLDASGCVQFSVIMEVIEAPNKPFVNPTVTLTDCSEAVLFPGTTDPTLIIEWTFGNDPTPIPDSEADGIVTVTSPGSYTVRAITAADPDCFTTATVTVPASTATLELGNDRFACINNIVALDASSPDWNEYVWLLNGQEVARGPRIDITSATAATLIYTLSVRNTNTGCTNTDQVSVTFSESTAPAAPSPDAICAGSPVPQLTATGTNIRWYSNAGLTTQVGTGNSFTPQINTNTPRTVTFYVTQTTGGCQSPATAVTITINPNPPVPTISGNLVICEGGNTTLTSSATAGNQWFRNGTAITGQTGRTLVVDQAGNYSVSVTANGCSVMSNTATVTVTAAPAAPVAQSPAGICAGSPVPALTATPTGINTIRWYSDAGLTTQVGTGNSFTPTTINNTVPGTYTFYATQGNPNGGCQSPATAVAITISAAPAAPAATNPAPVCAGGGLPTLSATGTDIRWYSDANLTNQVGTGNSYLPAVNASIPDTYTFYAVQTVNGCQSPATPVTLTINRSPVVDLGPDRNVCADSLEVLDANVNGINQGATFLWSTTQTTPTIRPTRSGTYSVTVTIGNCIFTDEVTITVLPAIRTNIPSKAIPLCTEDAPIEPVTLDAGPGQNFTYFWPHSGETTQTVEVSQLGNYIVRISDGSGCTKQDTINVIPRCDARVFVPDAFSPNDDGRNDNLKIDGKYLVDTKLIIFSRWGEVIYTAEDILNPDNFWDGTYLDRPAPIGSYAWTITYKSRDNPNAEPVEIRGGIMLLR